MKTEGITRCFCADSDVLLFSNINAIAPYYAHAELTHVRPTGPLFGYINSLSSLEAFCDYVLFSYSDPTRIAFMEAVYRDHLTRNADGGICDMSLFEWFREAHPGSYIDLTVPTNGVVFDGMLSLSDGFEMEHGIKKLQRRGQQFFGRTLASGEEVKFAALHFQGGSKALLPGYITHRGPRFWRLRIVTFFRRVVVRVSERRG